MLHHLLGDADDRITVLGGFHVVIDNLLQHVGFADSWSTYHGHLELKTGHYLLYLLGLRLRLNLVQEIQFFSLSSHTSCELELRLLEPRIIIAHRAGCVEVIRRGQLSRLQLAVLELDGTFWDPDS